VRRRHLRQLRRLRSGQRHAAVAHADRPGVERTANLHGGRPPARTRRGRRHALRVHAVSVTFCSGYTRARRRERVSAWGWGPTREKKMITRREFGKMAVAGLAIPRVAFAAS